MNPLTRRATVYIPDFIIVYVDADGATHSEVVEIKPSKESPFHSSIREARSQRAKASLILNQAKWQAAMAWCKRNGMTFRVMTESQIYEGTRSKPRKPRRKKSK